MGLIETLVLLSYGYTTAAFGWLFKRLEKQHKKLISNHFAHVDQRLDALEKKTGITVE